MSGNKYKQKPGLIYKMMSSIGKRVLLGKNAQIEEYVEMGVGPDELKKLETVIGNNAILRSHTVIYAGNIIGSNFQTGHGVLIRERNKIGDNVSIGSHTIVERDNLIGNNVRIHSNCYIPEFVIIKDNVWISPSTAIMTVLHPPCPRHEDCAKHVVIEENAKIGGGVTIGPRVTIGRNSLIGMGSVVTKDIPPDVVAVGNPATPLKKIDDLECVLGFFNTPYEWERDT